MIYLNNYCTDFLFPVVMVSVTYSSTMLSLIIFNFPLVFKISLLLKFMSAGFNYKIYSSIPTKCMISKKQNRN